MVCNVFHVSAVSEVAPALNWSSSGEALHVLVWSKKCVRDPELIPLPTSRGSVRPVIMNYNTQENKCRFS